MLKILFLDIGWAKVKVLFLKKCEKLRHKKTPAAGGGPLFLMRYSYSKGTTASDVLLFTKIWFKSITVLAVVEPGS